MLDCTQSKRQGVQRLQVLEDFEGRMKRKKSAIAGDRENVCFICGKQGRMEKHHMLHGPYRKAADRFHLVCHLCRDCHQALHDKGLHDRELQVIAQRTFERMYGHTEFMQVFGKSWIEGGEDE